MQEYAKAELETRMVFVLLHIDARYNSLSTCYILGAINAQKEASE